MTLTEKKVEKVIWNRLLREFNKLIIEGIPMPFLYLEGYKVACNDIYWELTGKILQPKKQSDFYKKYLLLIQKVNKK
jgi:hypothetical protein